MWVHRSNRTERLVEVLGDVVSTPLADPLAREQIAVQGRGMERWLSMQLARRFGVWANPAFPFPRLLVQQQVRTVLGENALDPAFEPEALRWSIAARLPALLTGREFDAPRRYLEADPSSFRLLQLAERIATLFDQYVVFRPEMVLSWEQGEETHWQARLWRALTEGRPAAHMAACARLFAEAVTRRDEPPPGLPTRISLFGLSTLAPLYLRILSQLSQWSEIHLFILSPSREFWAQIRSERESLRGLAANAVGDGLEESLRRDAGNPLLASLGMLGREFQHVLESFEYVDTDADLYDEPASSTMLMTLQNDMLTLRYRSARGGDAPPLPLVDDSIEVHVCHSPTREVEVLHDQLRHLFETDESLEPKDVIVMSPEIDEYAPLIEAVFGATEDGRHRIPYRIADRRLRATEEVVHAFLAVLAAIGGRLPASRIVDLLELDAVRSRFGITAARLDDLRAWIKGSGIRWGIDADHRRAAGQPGIEINTWRFGLDRLFLGYGMPGGGRQLFGGVLPFDDIEGTAAASLGALAEFCDQLFRFYRDFARPRPVHRWRDDLGELLDAMISADHARAYQHQQIRSALAALATHAQAGGFDGDVELETVRQCLEEALEQQAPGRNFLAGGVTFCALVPMRTIPFEVVCLLGMNDDVFPRARRPLAFDLMLQRPRAGDRSRRDDDRYLFLEALLSARRKLIVTYVGQSVHDNAEQPPSVVISELLDTVDESFRPAQSAERQMSLFTAADDNAAGPRERIVMRHPLQPFSPNYFRAPGSSGLISYSRRQYEAARALVERPGGGPTPFVVTPLPAPEQTAPQVSIDQLVRFFENPPRAFLRERLSLFLGDDLETMEDREPVDLNALEQWMVGDALLAAALRGEQLDDVRPCIVAQGWLPPGTLGVCELDEIQQQAQAVASATAAVRGGLALDDIDVDVMLGSTRITGNLRDRWPSGYSQCQYSKLGRRHELAVWVRHLFVNWLAPAGQSRESYLIGRGKNGVATLRFAPVDDAESLLCRLVALYWHGLTVPLPLFEKSSRAYTERFVKEAAAGAGAPAAHVTALSVATRAYDPENGERFPDIDNPYVEQAFRYRRPVADDDIVAPAPPGVPARFSDLALAIYEPLLAHREVEE